MEQEEFDELLRQSAFFRHMMVELLQSVEQAMAIVIAATAVQLDVPQLKADLLDLQQGAAVDDPNPTRDHILNSVRDRVHARNVS
jgi:hypothetical protein